MSEIMTFLSELKANNTLDWMHEHKARHRSASGCFEALVQDIILELACDEPELSQLRAKDLTFRLNRDTRFSSDKSPYNPAFRAHISPGGKAPIPVGYFLTLTPGGSFFGGGLFVPPGLTAMTNHVRDHIVDHGGELEEIVTDPAFAAEFTLLGEKLKKIPQGYPQDFPQGELLKMKGWYLERPFPDEALEDREGFIALAAETFRKMRPLHAYLNRALQGFRMPERGR